MSLLPASLRQLAESASPSLALKVASIYGGRLMYVPRAITPECRLARDLGEREARLVLDAVGFGSLKVPMCTAILRHRRDERMRADRRNGASHAQIALKHNVDIRTVERVTSPGASK